MFSSTGTGSLMCWAGRYENVEVFNGAADETGEDDYTVVYGGVRLERASRSCFDFRIGAAGDFGRGS